MSVISLESGEQIGTVKGYIIDPKAITIAAVLLERSGGWFKDARVITFDNIKNVGEHAITVGITKCIERASSLPEILALTKQDIDIIGTKVISGDGNLLGTTEEFYFDPATGQILAIDITGRLFDALFKGRAMLNTSYIETLGKHAIIVKTEAKDNLERLETGLSEKMKNVKEKSNKVWNSTVETTKRWSEAITKSVENFTTDEEEGEVFLEKEQPLPDKSQLEEADKFSDTIKEKTP